MTVYAPVLKGKPGEFMAWGQASATVQAATRPLFEVVPVHGAARDLEIFANNFAPVSHAETVPAIDTGFLDQTVPVDGSAHGPLLWMATELHGRGVATRPVIRLDDDPVVLGEAARAVAIHGAGAVLRLGSEEEDPDPAAAAAALPSVLAITGLAVGDIHLVIDFREVENSRTAARLVPIAEAVVRWADSVGPWASVTSVSGAFPASISNLDKDTHTPLPRVDAEFWNNLSSVGGLPLVPDFGDYGVNHPSMPVSVPRGPLPNLRYTYGDEWWVWRENRALPGNESFFTLCGRVVASPAWTGHGHCWGDAQVQRCSTSAGGPGRPVEWRAYSTSHHLAVVTDHLATTGAP